MTQFVRRYEERYERYAEYERGFVCAPSCKNKLFAPLE